MQRHSWVLTLQKLKEVAFSSLLRPSPAFPGLLQPARAEALPPKAELGARVSFFVLPRPLLSWVTLDWRLDLPESLFPHLLMGIHRIDLLLLLELNMN